MTYEITNKTKFIATCSALVIAIAIFAGLLTYFLLFRKKKVEATSQVTFNAPEQVVNKEKPEETTNLVVSREDIVNTEDRVNIEEPVVELKKPIDHLNSFIKKERKIDYPALFQGKPNDKEVIEIKIHEISFDKNTKSWMFDIYDPKNQLNEVKEGIHTGNFTYYSKKRKPKLFEDILDFNSLDHKDINDQNRIKAIFTKIFSTNKRNNQKDGSDGYISYLAAGEMKELCKILGVVEPDIIIENEPEKNADNDKTYVDKTYTENILEAQIVSDLIAGTKTTKDFIKPIVESKVEEVLENPKVKTGLGIAEKTFNFIEPKVTKGFEYPIITSIKVLTSLYNYDPTTKQVKEELELRKKSYLDSLNSFLKKQRNIEVEVEVDGALVKTVKIEKVLVSIVDIRFDEAKNEWTFKVNDPKNQLVDVITANQSITEKNPLSVVYRDTDIAKDILDIDHLKNADEGQKNKLEEIFKKIFSKNKPTKYEDGTYGYESSITDNEMKELCEILKLLLPEIEAPTTEDILRGASEYALNKGGELLEVATDKLQAVSKYALSKGSELLEVEEALQDLKELTNGAITIFK